MNMLGGEGMPGNRGYEEQEFTLLFFAVHAVSHRYETHAAGTKPVFNGIERENLPPLRRTWAGKVTHLSCSLAGVQGDAGNRRENAKVTHLSCSLAGVQGDAGNRRENANVLSSPKQRLGKSDDKEMF
ncbi:hypothetical protein NDU88_007296 [Pleurodeles waltl]|uniref:Uncharacterized protein n=1 Tax=Pleurodeles waltl TaxID=8319 RepID=A0AAV7QPF1_PLEWA|nr:hypothetical protein NDU88_007296 [Pleurodeles waltl]